ncbi:MAG: DUF4870 domain-containing protein [Planctomycetota bacterium]|jgi:uncharacterized Tic20 family protein
MSDENENPAAQEQPEAEKPAEEPKEEPKAEEEKPAEEAAPAEEKPDEEAKPAEEAKPDEEAKPAEGEAPAAEGAPDFGEVKSDDKTMGMLCHLLGLFSFIGPLIIWLIKKDQSKFVDYHGKEALNFQLTLLIGYFIGGALTLVCIGYFVIMAAWVVSIIFLIMGTVAANKGNVYRYPMCIRFIK